MKIIPLSVEIPLSLEKIEELAKQVIADLEAEALRTIRQDDVGRGKSCLDKIDGINRFVDHVQRFANSPYYRQVRAAEEHKQFLQNRIATLKRKGKGDRS